MRIHPLKTPILASEVAVNIGLDVAADDMAVCVLGPGLEVLAREKIEHTEAAVKRLLARTSPGPSNGLPGLLSNCPGSLATSTT